MNRVPTKPSPERAERRTMTREEAIDVIRYLDDQCIWQEDCIQVGGCNHCKEAINMAIEVLQTEVVRCKDCIHYESDGGALMVCRIDDMVVDDTDYCSHGERKGGDSE